MNVFEVFTNINSIIITLFVVLAAYEGVIYAVSVLMLRRKFPKAKNNHKYAIIIPARNEESVISNLIDSIKKQKYPKDLITIIVVAHNCTDNTASIARENGAICYEHTDKNQRTKGYAIKHCFERIKEDYGIESFEGYFIFDADNILSANYVEKMNDAFDCGEKIIVGYRNSKNIDTNLVSCMSSMHFLLSNVFTHRPRAFLRLSTRVQGTGFLFASDLVKDGWSFVRLTEDRAFSSDCITKGYKITYNDEAVFYDEQPADLKIFFRQRLRWEKGFLQVIGEWGWRLFKGIFHKLSFSCYDMFFMTIPKDVILFFWGALLYFVGIAEYFTAGAPVSVFYSVFLAAITGIGVVWLVNILRNIFVFIFERKRIKKMPFFKKIIIIVAAPFFYGINTFIQVIALFLKVEWKTIPHNDKSNIDEIENTILVDGK